MLLWLLGTSLAQAIIATSIPDHVIVSRPPCVLEHVDYLVHRITKEKFSVNKSSSEFHTFTYFLLFVFSWLLTTILVIFLGDLAGIFNDLVWFCTFLLGFEEFLLFSWNKEKCVCFYDFEFCAIFVLSQFGLKWI